MDQPFPLSQEESKLFIVILSDSPGDPSPAPSLCPPRCGELTRASPLWARWLPSLCRIQRVVPTPPPATQSHHHFDAVRSLSAGSVSPARFWIVESASPGGEICRGGKAREAGDQPGVVRV